MRILIEVLNGVVTRVWAEDPSEVTVVVRDMDNIWAGDEDPINEDQSLVELISPRNAVY